MKKILVIEEDDKIGMHINKILNLANYEVVTAETGLKGIELAKEQKPDIILCNSAMHDIDGYCISNILSKNKETAKIPFILLNGIDNQKPSSGIGLSADEYLVKTFESVAIAGAIEQHSSKNTNPAKLLPVNLAGLLQLLDDAYPSKMQEGITFDYRTRTFEKKENIYYEGDPANTVFMIKQGGVKTVKFGPDGKEFIIDLYGTGELFGHIAIFEGNGYPNTAISLEETEVVLIPKDDFISLIHSRQDMANQFIKRLADNISEKEERLMTLAYNSVRARVAGALLQLQKKYRKDDKTDSHTIRVLRDDLAGVIGTTTESLIRTLTDFKQENMIETAQGEIKILNMEGLEKIRRFS